MFSELTLAVHIQDCRAICDIHSLDAYGLPYGISLIDRVRDACPNIAASDIGIFEWALLMNGEVSVPNCDICLSEGWTLPLSEGQARRSGKFDNRFFVVTQLTTETFAKAVGMQISKDGQVTLWEEGGFLELADIMKKEAIRKHEGLIERLFRWL